MLKKTRRLRMLAARLRRVFLMFMDPVMLMAS